MPSNIKMTVAVGTAAPLTRPQAKIDIEGIPTSAGPQQIQGIMSTAQAAVATMAQALGIQGVSVTEEVMIDEDAPLGSVTELLDALAGEPDEALERAKLFRECAKAISEFSDDLQANLLQGSAARERLCELAEELDNLEVKP